MASAQHSFTSSCASCAMLGARMRADLAVYVETAASLGHQRVARARLAYQAARNTLAAHVASHDATTRVAQPGPQIDF
jgi:hypothetical protein